MEGETERTGRISLASASFTWWKIKSLKTWIKAICSYGKVYGGSKNKRSNLRKGNLSIRET